MIPTPAVRATESPASVVYGSVRPMPKEPAEATDEDGGTRPAVDEAGVDLTLIRAYLALTPIERLRSLQNAVRAIQKFRAVKDVVRSK